jgi:uncharacterized protein YbjQ (UPF0145 family)
VTRVSWPGGLPPAARNRVLRARETGVAGSLLSVPASLCLAAEDLAPVGEVMGCVVLHRALRSLGCGVGGTPARLRRGSVGGTSGADSLPAGYDQLFAARRRAWTDVLGRLTLEARALGADGVVGIRLSSRLLPNGPTEYLGLGTAVRVRSGTRPTPSPWTTELTGEQLSATLRSGWLPRQLVLGMSMTLRHDTWQLRRQASALNQENMEVAALTELLAAGRKDARSDLVERARPLGGEQIVVSRLTTTTAVETCRSGGTDHVVSGFVVATLLARSASAGPGPRPGTLQVLPLGAGQQQVER